MDRRIGSRRGRWLASAAFLAAFGAARVCEAQAGDAKRAEALFTEGRTALDAGDFALACAKFGESLKIVTRASTLLNLAQCEERQGKVATSLRHWREGTAMLDAADERRRPAEQRMAELDRKVPRLSVRLPADSPAGSRVSLDGAPIADAALATPIPVDPGEHTLTLEAPGRAAASAKVALAEGEQKEVALAAGAPLAAAPAAPPPVASPPPRAPVADSPGGGDGKRTLGFVAGGVGLAGLVVAGITGGLLMSRDATIQEQCPEKRCTPEGFDTIEGNGPLVAVNYVGFGVGAVGLGLGAFLILTSGGGDATPAAGVAPLVLPGGAGLSMRRAF